MSDNLNPTEWEEIATEPDSVTQKELQAALAARLAHLRSAAPAEVIPPSLDITVPTLHALLEEESS